MNVPFRFDGLALLAFLNAYHPHVDTGYWISEIAAGRILYKDQPLVGDSTVWAGQRLVHLLAGTIEPPVNAEIRLIHEDDLLIGIDKPAPLAMHPCGRFNRNTLSFILNAVYHGEKIRMTHRLDANTSGVVVMARKQAAAQAIQKQFEAGTVTKVYLARVCGHPEWEAIDCQAPISRRPETSGMRIIEENGLEARTEFRTVRKFTDGTSLIECYPQTGRTNQIRLHLWNLGFPIVNDPSYLPELKLGTNRTLGVDDPPMGLHAWKLLLQYPNTGEPLELESPPKNWCESEKLRR